MTDKNIPDMDECLKLVFDTYVRCINLEGEFALTCPIGMYLYEKDGKYMCKGLTYFSLTHFEFPLI